MSREARSRGAAHNSSQTSVCCSLPPGRGRHHGRCSESPLGTTQVLESFCHKRTWERRSLGSSSRLSRGRWACQQALCGPRHSPRLRGNPLGGAGVGIGSARRQLWRPPRGRCRGRRAGPRLFSTAGESSEWPTRACTFLTEWQGLRCHSELSASGRAEATAAPGSTARPGGPARCSSAPTLLTTFS